MAKDGLKIRSIMFQFSDHSELNESEPTRGVQSNDYRWREGND